MHLLRTVIFSFVLILTIQCIVFCLEDDLIIPPFVRKIVEKVEERSPPNPSMPELTPDDLLSEYDYIIVGSGPAGCAVTNRLSENPHCKVLLLEAGPRPTTLHQIPLFAQYADQPGYNWNYRINPYPGSCLALNGQQCMYPLGKMLGGSSSLNYMVYARGNPSDYDNWAKQGNYGWSFKDLLPLFHKIEDTTLVYPVDSNQRGLNGSLSVAHSKYRTELAESFIEASKERNLQLIDYNGALQIGVDYVQSTIRNGRRESAAEAYLDPIKGRENLHIMTNSLVSKVLIDSVTKTAEGVEYIYNEEIHRVKATKEVILAAGPINSPQLLMLSGIGPRHELSVMNISVLQDLPVGKNYADHVTIPALIFLTNTSGENIHFNDLCEDDVDAFIEGTSGKLSTPAAFEAISFYNMGLRGVEKERADIEFIFSAGRNELGYTGFTSYRDEVYEGAFKSTEDSRGETLSYFILDLYPDARGNITLRGTSILNPPIIEFSFLSSPTDMEAHLKGIKEAVALAETKEFRKKGVRVNNIPLPGCIEFPFGSDDYWKCYIRNMARNNCHISNSAKMGPSTDPDSVVDPELRVIGINKLRVADTSIAPSQISGHSQAVGYLIGEKMADILIKGSKGEGEGDHC